MAKEGLKRNPTQADRILDYINKFGSITSMQAYTNLGISQLGARIFELKKLGYLFSKERIKTKNHLGKNTYYDKYKIVGYRNE